MKNIIAPYVLDILVATAAPMSLFHNCWTASAGWPRQFSRRLRAPANSPQDEEAASAPCNGRELRTSRKGTCQGEGDSDGGLVRHTERALRLEAGQGPDVYGFTEKIGSPAKFRV